MTATATDKRILLADDDPTLRTLLSGMLTKWGYQVETVTNGEDALAAMTRSDPPRLVLLDWAMPIIDGLELCQLIRERFSAPGCYVHIIMLTNHDSPSSVAAALDAGAGDFVKKPAEPLELRARIEAGVRMIAYERELLAEIRASRWDNYRDLCSLAETRDKAGDLHMDRVGAYTAEMCRQLGAPEELVDEMARFAMLHDIGKIGVADTILLVPGELSPEQFAAVKTHARLGAQILGNDPDLATAAEICRSHHERWDGDGYPDGLMGEDIPVAGRITAVADVYDVLRSRRHYKQPWSHIQAMNAIREGAGSQFDPVVVEAFSDLEATIVEIAAEFDNGDYEEI